MPFFKNKGFPAQRPITRTSVITCNSFLGKWIHNFKSLMSWEDCLNVQIQSLTILQCNISQRNIALNVVAMTIPYAHTLECSVCPRNGIIALQKKSFLINWSIRCKDYITIVILISLLYNLIYLQCLLAVFMLYLRQLFAAQPLKMQFSKYMYACIPIALYMYANCFVYVCPLLCICIPIAFMQTQVLFGLLNRLNSKNSTVVLESSLNIIHPM